MPIFLCSSYSSIVAPVCLCDRGKRVGVFFLFLQKKQEVKNASMSLK